MFQEVLPADTLARFRKSTEAGEVIGDNRLRAEIKSVLARRIERTDHSVTDTFSHTLAINYTM